LNLCSAIAGQRHSECLAAIRIPIAERWVSGNPVGVWQRQTVGVWQTWVSGKPALGNRWVSGHAAVGVWRPSPSREPELPWLNWHGGPMILHGMGRVNRLSLAKRRSARPPKEPGRVPSCVLRGGWVAFAGVRTPTLRASERRPPWMAYIGRSTPSGWIGGPSSNGHLRLRAPPRECRHYDSRTRTRGLHSPFRQDLHVRANA
jgi:hypothetical protein